MRARWIKPSFFQNEKLSECEPLARLLLASLWCQADCDGRLEDRPAKIKALSLPYDDCDVFDLLRQLEEQDFIVRYSFDGRSFISIPNFKKHARPHPKEPSFGLPSPPEQAVFFNGELRSNSVFDSNSYPPNPPSGGEREEILISNPVEPLMNPSTAVAATETADEQFESAWRSYPRKERKQDAKRTWEVLSPTAAVSLAIIAAIQRDSRSPNWQRSNGRFVPQLWKYLRDRRWEDAETVMDDGRAETVLAQREKQAAEQPTAEDRAETRRMLDARKQKRKEVAT